MSDVHATGIEGLQVKWKVTPRDVNVERTQKLLCT
jgi:hypothetical protein